MNDVAELISDLDSVIQKQAQIIDRLFILLLEHISVDEFGSVLTEMEDAAAILCAYQT